MKTLINEVNEMTSKNKKIRLSMAVSAVLPIRTTGYGENLIKAEVCDMVSITKSSSSFVI